MNISDSMLRSLAVVILALSYAAITQAGMIVEVRDPRQLQQQQQIIFPQAEVKVVALEFEASAGDERGKQQAKALHDRFLKQIHDVQGAAIVTYVAPSGERIQDFRATVEQVARNQQAQIAVWGRVYVDAKGSVLTNVRLMLIEPPAGVSSDFVKTSQLSSGAPVNTRGVIDAPVLQTRIDFTTVSGDISPLADFLSGLVRYYKAATRDGATATRWLQSSSADFERYLVSTGNSRDSSTAAQAHLYLARIQVRLAAIDARNATGYLLAAKQHADQAAQLNPYNAEAPTVQAVIAARTGASADTLRSLVGKAIKAAPLDTTNRVNAAMLDSAQGNIPAATRQLNNASVILKTTGKDTPPAVKQLQESISRQR